jgi:type IV secretory pathway TrbL component
VTRRLLIPAIVLLIILIYVPHIAESTTRGAHEIGAFLTHTGRGLGHLLDKVTS